MKNTLIAAAVGLISWVAWSGWGWLSGGAPVDVAAAREESIREVVEERGTTRLAKTYLLTMPANGRVEEIIVKEGEPVAKGAPVARLKSDDMALELRLAKAALNRAQAAVKENQDLALENTSLKQANRYVESMQHTVKASEKRKDSGKARFEFARDVFQRMSNLVNDNRVGGVITREQLDESQLRMIEGDNSFQQDQLVHKALQAMQAATDLLPQMIIDYVARKKIQTEKLERERDQAQTQLEEIELRHRRGVMTSPVTGVVLQRPIQHEKYLSAGTTLLELGDLNDLEVEADVLSQDMVRVRQGQAVEIVDASRGEALRGKVLRKYSAGFTKISSLGVEQQRVRVIIGFDGQDRQRAIEAELGVGFRVQVRIVTREKQNALSIPRSALFRGSQGEWQVYEIVSRRAQLREVQVGLINDQLAEIVTGLEAGQQVVLAPEASLMHGVRVKPRPR